MNNRKILLVDDEENLRETISEMLTHQNFTVMAARNGQEALKVLDFWIPDLIICDIMMPVMDGKLFHENVKNNNLVNHIPFIFLTAMANEDVKEESILNGADYYLTKPFKIDNLLKIINAKIERFDKIKNAYNTVNASNNKHFTHEINTPLNGILGPVNLLINRGDSFEPSVKDQFYDAIKISAVRLERTLKNSMLYQNLKNNELDFEDGSYCEIAAEFTKVQAILKKTYNKETERILHNLEPSNIKINSKYLQFILFELIDNAMKFSTNNEKIIVSGKKNNTGFFVLTIIDFGIGFTEEEIKEINVNKQFNREKMEQQGLGLGLFISKTLVIRAKGMFNIVSQKDKGTTITISLPLYV